MEITEERVREIVREEVSRMREEWKRTHTWDDFLKFLDENVTDPVLPTRRRLEDR